MEIKTTVNRNMRVLVLLGLATLAIALTALLSSGFASASSHREAPAISKDPYADTTDVYAFMPPGQTENIVLAASWIPFEGPEGGPNYFEWDDSAQYQIHVDNDGDAVADFTFELTSNTAAGTLDSFLYNNGPIGTAGENWLRPQTYSVTETVNDTLIVGNQLAPPVNIGAKSTPNWVADFFNPVAGANNTSVYAGQTDDAFWVDLQVFDLLTLRGQDAPVGYGGMGDNNDPVDSVAGFNVHSLVLEMPVANLLASGETVLGVWATTTRDGMATRDGAGGATQVSRLGMPLVNEAVIPMAAKDIFNSLAPANDLGVYIDQGAFKGLLQEAVENPELGTLLCALYSVPLPEDSDSDCNTEYTATDGAGVGAGSGRGDIFEIFLTGMVLKAPFDIVTGDGTVVTLPAGTNVNQFGGASGGGSTPSEMLRINTALAGDTCRNDPDFSRLGVLGGDACGFPNGRRPTDDIVEIELLAVAGAAYALLDGQDTDFTFNADLIAVLDDGINANDVPFTTDGDRNHGLADKFPYLAAAQSGQSHIHDNPMGTSTAINLDSLQSAGMFDSALPEIALGLLALTMFVGAVYATRTRANRQ